ncbi:transposase, IS4 family [Candidatus Electrothrix aarhusensis]|uniref:Transposase, IS4 family n=1 Tax=Candidatus Electrothrix aarhusensis TaxID=1859131 RepID=A0A444J0L1_9BACT|nr:transposase, IS4 family [Candidatus Electrothrix aarhusensis]
MPFSDILSTPYICKVVEEETPKFRNRVFTPIVTLQTFISQVLSQDHSCRDAVARVLADRIAQDKKPCSGDTSPYCRARMRLPEKLIMRLLRETGRNLHNQSEEGWKWKGRSVKLVDGTTISMPDTPENQDAFPQVPSQKEGLGFPIVRLVAIISLSCGSVLDYAFGPYQGKETGEHALLRQIVDSLVTGDILLGDRYYCSYFLIAMLQQKGVDVVFQLHARRKPDFRRGIRLGPRDHLVYWSKPARPEWMDETTYNTMPDTLAIREIKAGGKVISSTLLDPKKVTKKELADLYVKRWLIEVDLRSIKDTLQMDVLRCKTPEMIRKEIGVHLLAYNLIRTVIAQSASLFGILPREISFKGTVQTLEAFRDKIFLMAKKKLPGLYRVLLKAVAEYRVGNRPGRSEPRAVKRRPKAYPRLTVPRRQAV